jgi:hypothetical protein
VLKGLRASRVKGACMRAVKHGDVSFEPRMHATTECANVASVVLKGVRASHFKVAIGHAREPG